MWVAQVPVERIIEKIVEKIIVKEVHPNPDAYKGASPVRNSAPLGPYSMTMLRALWKPWGWGLFLMSEVLL